MSKKEFLTILLVVTYFLGGVVSVTDKEFEGEFVKKLCWHFIRRCRQALKKWILSTVLVRMLEDQQFISQQLKEENLIQAQEIERQGVLLERFLNDGRGRHIDVVPDDEFRTEEISAQNATIEERVALLEIQVTDLEENVVDLDEDVDFLFDEQVIQDERLFSLEQETDAVISELDLIEDDIESLELTAADHETRLTTGEEIIQGLQLTDVELNARITALEESGDSTANDTVASHAVLTTYNTISEDAVVPFDIVLLNEGEGFNSITSTFTVPSRGDGFYYYSVFLNVDNNDNGFFDLQVNGNAVCTAHADEQDTANDPGLASCSAVTYATEGATVRVVYRQGNDENPLHETTLYYVHGFNGFRI